MKKKLFSNYNASEFFIVLFLILCSGTVVFNIKYNNIFIPFVMIVAILFSYIKKNAKLSFENGIKLLIIVGIMLINTFIHTNNGVAYNAVIQIVCYFIATCFVFNFIEFKRYKLIFIDVVSILAVVSIVIFIGVNIGIIPISNEVINGKAYVMALGHVVGWSNYVFVNRMCGLFHEPGMYQIILNMALVFLSDDLLKVAGFKFSKKQKIQLLILMSSVLLTRSTSGYIMLAFIVVWFLILKRKSIVGKNQKIMYRILLPTIVLASVFIIVQNSVIIDKFQANNVSFSTRMNDYLGSLEMVRKSPILGYGIESKSFFSGMLEVGITSQSNGIFAIVLMLGVPYVLIFAIFMLVNIKKNQNWLIGIIPIIVMMMVQGVTENCLYFPIILAFVFGREKLANKNA